MVVVERSSMSTASAGTWRLSVRYRRIDSASDTTSSLPCPPEATNTPVLPCFSHNATALSMRPRSSGVGIPSGMSPAPWMMM